MSAFAMTAVTPGACPGGSPVGTSSRFLVSTSLRAAGKRRPTGHNSRPRWSRLWPSTSRRRRSPTAPSAVRSDTSSTRSGPEPDHDHSDMSVCGEEFLHYQVQVERVTSLLDEAGELFIDYRPLQHAWSQAFK